MLGLAVATILLFGAKLIWGYFAAVAFMGDHAAFMTKWLLPAK